MTPPLDPSPLLQLAFGFWPSKVVLTAVEFDLFTILGDRRLTGEQLGAELKLHPRGIYDFFDTLVALNVLSREGDGPAGLYHNTDLTSLYFRRDSPRYIGGILIMFNARLFKFWHDLPEALRTGQPQNETKHGQKGVFEELYSEPARLEQFVGAMTGFSRLNFEALAQQFNFSAYRSLCDVGGAAATLSIEVAKAHPQIQCASFDLPMVSPIAQRAIDAAGLADRVKPVSGNFFSDDLPQADIITMGMILHDWNLEKKQLLIRKAYEALPADGAFLVVETIIDDARRENAMGLMMSLNMLIEFGEAFDYSAAQFEEWCRAAGFRRFERIPLAGPSSACVAYK